MSNANPQAMILAILAGKAEPLTAAEIRAAFPAGEAPICPMERPDCDCQIEHALIFLVARRAVESRSEQPRRYSIRRSA